MIYIEIDDILHNSRIGYSYYEVRRWRINIERDQGVADSSY
jgi:hypothetical protein